MSQSNLYDVFWQVADAQSKGWALIEEVQAFSDEGAHQTALAQIEKEYPNLPITCRSYLTGEATQVPYKQVTRWEQA